MGELRDCPDCAVKPGEVHDDGYDVENCSGCGSQRLSCGVFEERCENHDPLFARWTGIWPGEIESEYLGLDLNQFTIQGYNKIFFVKPTEE